MKFSSRSSRFSSRPIARGCLRFCRALKEPAATARDLIVKVQIGPAVLRLRSGLDREPDIFFVSTEQMGNIGEEYVSEPVDFVIEVLSESSRTRDLREKAKEYEAAGILQYWVIDLGEQAVVTHRLKDRVFDVETVEHGRLESTAAAGFWIDVNSLWRRPLPSESECLHRLMGEARVG